MSVSELSLETLLKEELELRKEREKREENILEWGKYYFPHVFESHFSDLHRYLVSIYDEPITSTEAARGHAKSTILCFLIPLYLALTKTGRYKHFLQIQASSTKAVLKNIAIRNEIETNEKIIRDYGLLVSDKKWTENQFVLSNGTIFTAIGVGKSMRGIAYDNVRPDFFILDDLYDQDDKYNPERIKKKSNWVWESLYLSKPPFGNTAFHIIGTPIHRSDLLQGLKKLSNVKTARFPAIIDFDTKKTLWKPFDELMKDKELLGSIAFTQEYQCEVRDDETSIIKEKDIQYYDGCMPGHDPIIKTIGGVDPAIGEKSTSDFTGKALVYESKFGNFYVHEIKNDRLSFDKNMLDIKNWCTRIKFSTFRIEEIAGFQAFGDYIRANTKIPLKRIKMVKDKLTRLQGVSPLFENKKVFINENIPAKLRNELVEQLINNNPTHDDLRDAVILCLECSHTATSFAKMNNSGVPNTLASSLNKVFQ